MSAARSKGPAQKGFMPKTPTETSTQKKDSKNIGEKEGSIAPTSSEIVQSNKKTLEIEGDKDEEIKVDIDEEQATELPLEKTVNEEKIIDEVSSMSKTVAVAKGNQVVGNGRIGGVDDNVTVPVAEIAGGGRQFNIVKNDDIIKEDSVGIEEKTTEDASLKIKLEKEENLRKQEMEENLRKQEMEENLRRQEMEENFRKQEMEANLRKQEIERLAEENFSKGNKLFVYPELVKPDQDIEVFLDKSLSTLCDELDVLIMGAFNDWRWKSFTMRLNKTHLKGDWWSCQVHVPKEAYKVDFVFFNGQNVYDNNDNKDFCIPVEGGMDLFAFDDFLLEEKCRELKKLAKEQAERERQDEEQRQREAEIAASEADRVQARVETEKRREILQRLMKNAASSVDNVWYIEPSEFKGEDMITLYYKKSSGPLANASDLWIHGGHNNWRDGLSIVEKLASSEGKDGDWWYANGMCGCNSSFLIL